MSDIDDLLDDLEKEEIFQERKEAVTKNKHNFLDEYGTFTFFYVLDLYQLIKRQNLLITQKIF